MGFFNFTVLRVLKRCLFLKVGRSTDKPIDVTVKDTKSGGDSEGEEAPADQRKLPNIDNPQAHRDSTISRFACRLLINRTQPFTPRVFAAGFDNHRNICLGVRLLSLLALTCDDVVVGMAAAGKSTKMAHGGRNGRINHEWRADISAGFVGRQ